MNTPTILAVVGLLFPAHLLAATISTTDNSGFFSIPSWMPTSVASTNTPGSPDFVSHRSITTTDAAALYACFNAYVERCYYLNNGMSNVWNKSVYGPTAPAWFKTPADLQFRTTPISSRGLYGLTNMWEIARHCTIPSFYCYRPSWPCDRFAISSSVLRKYDDGWNTLLDPGIMPNVDWTDDISQLDFHNELSHISMFFPDTFCPQERDAISHDSKRSMIMSAIHDIAHGAFGDMESLIWWYQDEKSTFPNSVSNYFKSAQSVIAITTPANTLQSIQPWMSAAGMMFSVMDRAYTANRFGAAVSNTTYFGRASRKATWDSTDGNVTLDVAADGSVTFSPHSTISKSDWAVTALTATNYATFVSNHYWSSHSIDIEIGNVNLDHGGNGVAQPVGGSFGYSVADFMIDTGAPWNDGEWEFQLVMERNNAYRCIANGTECGLHVCNGTFTINPLQMSFSASRDYTYTQTDGQTVDIGARLRPSKPVSKSNAYTMICSYLVNDTDSDVVTNTYGQSGTYVAEVKCASGNNVAGYDLTDIINSSIAETSARIVEKASSRWGDWRSASSYAYVSETECSCNATVNDGEFHLSVGSYTRLATVTNGIMYNLRNVIGGETNVVCAGEVPSSYMIESVEGWFVPNLVPEDWTQTETNRPAHCAVGDGYCIQKQDFAFESLKTE